MIMSIGKWNHSGDTESVLQHLRDTGDVLKHLLTTIVPQQTIEAANLSLEEFCMIAEFCARVHDIGKCTPAFQYKTPRGDVLCAGYDSFNSVSSPHGLAGAAILHSFGVPMSICEVIAAHHGKTIESGNDANPAKQFHRFPENYGLVNDFSPYQPEWNMIYHEALEYSGIQYFVELNIHAQFLITGLLLMADWIASNEEIFPIEDTDNQELRINNALLSLDLPPMWTPTYSYIDDNEFLRQFGFYPNELQKACNKLAFESDGSGIMFIESTMGTGKTEAALSASEILGFNVGSGGLYFGLPTRATANAILPRVTEWITHTSNGERVSLRLAHGEAFHNAYYKELQIEDDNKGITINQWLSGRHRALLPDFVVGTVDQILTAGIAQKFVMLLHLGLSGKVVIIDEVHSYDAYMSTYLEAVLTWLGAYGVPVILLSATLTSEKKNLLVHAYTGKKIRVETGVYPCITWADKNRVITVPVNLNSPNKQIQLIRTPEERIIEYAIQAAQDGGCIGIIVNRVKDSQVLASEIKKRYEGKVILLHSRFLPKDRAKLEDEIVRHVGKKSDNQLRKGTIIIGTQVLEQSLDIDFDVLFTEICPMDLMLQRIGRLHRHSIHDSIRPVSFINPVCYIYKKSGRPIYDEYIIRRTEETLPDYIMLPSDIRKLIEDVYDLSMGTNGPDKQKFLKNQNDMRTRAEMYGLCKPDEYDSFKAITRTDNTRESVRFDMNTMQLIVLQTDENNNLQTLDKEFITDHPVASEMSLISEQKINLYFDEKLQKDLLKQKLPKWAEFFESDFLILDENGFANVNNYSFRYTKMYGLEEIN